MTSTTSGAFVLGGLIAIDGPESAAPATSPTMAARPTPLTGSSPHDPWPGLGAELGSVDKAYELRERSL
jgi:hypothetical protein